jgi:hypothetical protein
VGERHGAMSVRVAQFETARAIGATDG